MSRPALVLVRGREEAVLRWAAKGLAPVDVVPSVAWTLVAPAGTPPLAPPYDDAGLVLAGRRLPARLRPSLAFVVDGDRALVAATDRSLRARTRWLVWRCGVGLTDTGGLPVASLGRLTHLAHTGRDGLESLRHCLSVVDADPADVLDDVVAALRLPGVGVLRGTVRAADLPDAVRVDPDAQRVDRFRTHVGEEARIRAELEDR